MKKIIAILISVMITGCASAPQSFEQGLTLIEKASELAEKQGIAYSASISWNGTVGGAWIQRAELDSGVVVKFDFHGNAATERATVNDN